MNALLVTLMLFGQCPPGGCPVPSYSAPVEQWQWSQYDGGYVVPGSVRYSPVTQQAPIQQRPAAVAPAPKPVAPLVPIASPKPIPVPDPPKAATASPRPLAENLTVEAGPKLDGRLAAIERGIVKLAPADDSDDEDGDSDDLDPVPSSSTIPPWAWVAIAAVAFYLYSKRATIKTAAVAWVKANIVIIALAGGGVWYAYTTGWIPPVSEWNLPDWMPQPDPVKYIRPLVWVIHESGELEPKQAHVIYSEKIEAYLASRKSKPLQVRDDDDPDLESQEVIKAVRAKVPSGPGYAVYSSTKRQYYVGKLPSSADAWLKKIQQYGGK